MEIKKSFEEPLLRKRLHSLNEDDYLKEIEDHTPPKTFLQKLNDNWRPGLTVGLVNLPLCIALSVASGSTPSAGILSGIVGGLINGVIGGSNYNILGPTGALSGFLSICAFRYGMNSLPYFAIIAGIITIIVKRYGLAKYIDLFPLAVNEGFTLGVAFIIFLNQMNPALGIGKISDVYLQTSALNETSRVEKITKEVITLHEDSLIHSVVNNLKHLNQMNMQAFIIFLIFFTALFFLIKYFPIIPWHAFAAFFGILVGYSNYYNVETLMSKFGEIKLNFYDFSYTKIPLTFLLSPTVWVDAVPIAFITILETLISAKIADGLTHTTFIKRRELRGLGIANIVSGIFGGIPITAALARTTLNIKSGGTDRLSAVINGVVLFLIAFICIPFFKFLPLCVASAQVSMVAVRMINFEEIKVLYERDRSNFYILISTAGICIITDPTVGIIFGMLIYLINFSENLISPWAEIITTHETKAEIEEAILNKSMITTCITEETKTAGKIIHGNYLVENLNLFVSDLPKEEGDYILYRVIGIVNFMNVKEHTEKLRRFAMTDNVTVVVSFRYLHFIDLEAMHAIKHLLEVIANERNNSTKPLRNHIIVTGLNKENIKRFQDREWITDMHKHNMLIFKDHKKMAQSFNEV
jgi:SulP family sulfate permease